MATNPSGKRIDEISTTGRDPNVCIARPANCAPRTDPIVEPRKTNPN